MTRVADSPPAPRMPISTEGENFSDIAASASPATDEQALGRPNVFEIDLAPVAAAVRRIRSEIGQAVMLFAALKSNAYGFGLREVARTVLRAGADAVAVVDRLHAIALRRAGVRSPILVYAGNAMDIATAHADSTYDLIPTITDLATARLYDRHVAGRMRIAIKIDVGQERLGVPDTEAVAFTREVARLPHLEPYIINAHPAVPAGCPDEYVEWQYHRFANVCEALDMEGIRLPVRMFAASKVLARTWSMSLSGVDPGGMLFGLVEATKPPGPQPFHALKSRVIHKREIVRTEFRELAPFQVRPRMVLGVMPIGTSDGFASLNCGEVLIRGARVKVLGRPSLEYARLDLTDAPDVEVGDEVVIIGRQGNDEIAQEEVIAHQGLAGRTELVMAVRSSISRRYIDFENSDGRP